GGVRGGGAGLGRAGRGGARAEAPRPGQRGRAATAGPARRRVSRLNPYMASEVNRRTPDGGRSFSSRGVTTGLLLTQPLLAASGTFDGRCPPEAAPNTYPRVGHRVTQHDATTAGGSPRALE